MINGVEGVVRVLITCGPTYESLDDVRRLTNFSTGQLGTVLANYFVEQGHEVTLMRGVSSTYCGACAAQEIVPFTTTADLQKKLQAQAATAPDCRAVFHAAAVSDFRFGKVYRKGVRGELEEVEAGKLTTRDGNLLAELVPTPKLLPELRGLFPVARIYGWKYEVDGSKDQAIAAALRQVRESGCHISIINGPAYKPGFGIVTAHGLIHHCESAAELAEHLCRSGKLS